jgi:hypothetical protein
MVPARQPAGEIALHQIVRLCRAAAAVRMQGNPALQPLPTTGLHRSVQQQWHHHEAIRHTEGMQRRRGGGSQEPDKRAHFAEQLDRLGIAAPQLMFIEIRRDATANVGDRVMFHQLTQSQAISLSPP